MEFGIMPIAESQFTLLMLTCFKLINVHNPQYNHGLLNRVQKCRFLINNVLMFCFGFFGSV